MNTRCILAVLASLAVGVAACRTNEAGRSSLQLIPESVLTSMGVTAYQEATSEYPEVTSGRDYEMVQRVGRRIAEASGKAYEWEFKLLDAPEVVNAFALPGGKIAVYTGLLRVADSEDALAVVMGHEVAHATLGHGNERMTQNVISQLGMTVADLAAGTWLESDQSRAQVMEALGVATQYGVLMPFSRAHESEADVHGLRYVIRAGYDPWAAPALWERMAAASGGASVPTWMSTHPDPLDRAEVMREQIPQLLAEEGRAAPR